MNEAVLEHPRDEELIELVLTQSEERVGTHLAECPSCARFVKEIKEIKNDLGAIDEESIPDHVRETIFAAIRQNVFQRWMERYFPQWSMLLLIVGAILIIVVLLFVAIMSHVV